MNLFEKDRRQKSRNRGVFIVLMAIVALIYAITIVKIKTGG